MGDYPAPKDLDPIAQVAERGNGIFLYSPKRERGSILCGNKNCLQKAENHQRRNCDEENY
jgi:hypothetical protein